MRKHELLFTDREIKDMMANFKKLLSPENQNLGWIGILNDAEEEILAKILICNERVNDFCRHCKIFCETGCPTFYFRRVQDELERMLEIMVKYRHNIWPVGKIIFCYCPNDGVIVQINELEQEIVSNRQFANFKEPGLPKAKTPKDDILAAIFRGEDALAHLDSRYKK